MTPQLAVLMLKASICSKDIQYKDYKNVNWLDNFNVFFW